MMSEVEILFKTKGGIGGDFKANIDAKDISARWLSYSALQVPNINLKASSSTGSVWVEAIAFSASSLPSSAVNASRSVSSTPS